MFLTSIFYNTKLIQVNATIHETVPPPPDTPPIEFSLQNIKNNTKYNTNIINLTFTVSFSTGTIYRIEFETDWQKTPQYAYYQFMDNYEFPNKVTYSYLLAGVPKGNHTISISVSAGGGYGDLFTYYNYGLTDTWKIFFTIENSASTLSPPDSIICLDMSGSKVWNYTTKSTIKSDPVANGGYLYFGTDDGTLYCLNASTGNKIWNQTLIGGNYPTVSNGYIFVGTRKQYMYCLNASTGNQVWNSTVFGEVSSKPVVNKDSIYVGTDRGYLYSLNASTGNRTWMYTAGFSGGPILSSPTYYDGLVYFGSLYKKVYAVNATNGELAWSYSTGDRITSSPAVVNDKMYVGSWDSQFYYFDAVVGTLKSKHLLDSATSSSATLHNDQVYIGSDGGIIYCLDNSFLNELWNFTTNGVIESSPVGVGSYIIVGSADGNIYYLDGTSGVEIWSYATGGYVWSTPAFMDNYIYAVSKTNPSPLPNSSSSPESSITPEPLPAVFPSIFEIAIIIIAGIFSLGLVVNYTKKRSNKK